MYRPLFSLSLLLAVTAFPVGTVAGQNLVRNGSFESYTGLWEVDGFGVIRPAATTLTDWEVTGSRPISVFRTPNSYEVTGAQGSQWLDLTGVDPFGRGSMRLYQFITGLTAGRQYRFSMWLGVNNGSCGIGLGGCVGPISARSTIGAFSTDFTHAPTGPGNEWAEYGFSFTATRAFEELEILGTSGPANGIYLGLDDVRIVEDVRVVPDIPTVVPEPSTYALLATGLASLAVVARRRRRA